MFRWNEQIRRTAVVFVAVSSYYKLPVYIPSLWTGITFDVSIVTVPSLQSDARCCKCSPVLTYGRLLDHQLDQDDNWHQSGLRLGGMSCHRQLQLNDSNPVVIAERAFQQTKKHTAKSTERGRPGSKEYAVNKKYTGKCINLKDVRSTWQITWNHHLFRSASAAQTKEVVRFTDTSLECRG